MFEIKDLAGLSQPLTKLIEVISSGMGALYRPMGIRCDAKAQADAIRIIGAAQTDVEASNRLVLAEVSERIEDRTAARVAKWELIRQTNLEAIAASATSHMPDEASSDPVDEDWKARFFSVAADVSNKDMQDLWGRILAGEVAKPGTYSLRALEILRNLSQGEAEAFRKIRYLATNLGYVFKYDNNNLNDFGVPFHSILDLRAAGLVADGDLLNATWTWLANSPYAALLFNGKVLLFNPKDANLREAKLDAYVLTRVGIELLSLIEPEVNRNYLRKLSNKYKDKFDLLLGEPGQSRESFALMEPDPQ